VKLDLFGFIKCLILVYTNITKWSWLTLNIKNFDAATKLTQTLARPVYEPSHVGPLSTPFNNPALLNDA